MVPTGSKHVLIESLSSMKASLESAYEFKTRVEEEARLLQGLGEKYTGYRVFSDYRRNEGKRRFNEISEFINRAVNDLECCDARMVSSIYLDALKGVLLHTRWIQVLETYSNSDEKKK